MFHSTLNTQQFDTNFLSEGRTLQQAMYAADSVFSQAKEWLAANEIPLNEVDSKYSLHLESPK